MTTEPTPEKEQPDRIQPEIEAKTGPAPEAGNLISDPDYLKLLEHYQQAEFKECKKLLEGLEERYPDHPILVKFREELELKLSVSAMRDSIEAGEKRYKRKATMRLSVFAIVGTLLVLIAFFVALSFFLGEVEIPEPAPTVQDTAQLALFYQQAEQLLASGQPQPALEIIDKIRETDPEYPSLSDLTARSEELLQFEAQYQKALGLLAEGNDDEALEIFRAIEAENPSLWDVDNRIAAIEKARLIEQYLADGNAAFRANNWLLTISAYEEILKLDARFDNSQMKEQLVNSYLNQIIIMLDQENPTITEIETAEGYYRKAMALIPQDRAFITERGNLQEVSRDLLVVKLTQFAKYDLQDKSQTLAKVNRAVSYYRKATELVPNNITLLQDLQSAQTYHSGFYNFINKNWEEAIESLDQLVSANPDYAGGNASVLLYESYYALAKRYYSARIFQDALGYLEQAEFLVWGTSDNLVNLFQIQAQIGDTLGQMEDYENAVSYYQYALNAIKASATVQNFPAISTRLTEAENAAANGDYENAYHAFQDVLTNSNAFFTTSELSIRSGVCLALFANQHGSTLELVLEANNLPYEMVMQRSTTLLVPTIEE